MTTIELPGRHLCEISLKVDPANALDIGKLPIGRRQIVPILGGTFSGDSLQGTVLPGGADWVLYRPNGEMQIDVRIVLETDDKSLIYMNYAGVLHTARENLKRLSQGDSLTPEEYTLATAVVLESGAEAYRWLNDQRIVGRGRLDGINPTYDLYLIE